MKRLICIFVLFLSLVFAVAHGPIIAMSVFGILGIQTISNVGSIRFTANGNYAAVADQTEFNVGQTMTAGCWVKASTGDLDPFVVIFGQWDVEGPGTHKFSWAIEGTTGSDRAAFLVSDLADSTGPGNLKHYQTSSTTVWNGTWRYVAMTFNNNVFKIYLDGVEDATPNIVSNGTLTGGNIGNSTANLSVGCDSNGQNCMGRDATTFADGCAFWNSVLSASEITEIYNNGTGGSELNLNVNSGDYISAGNLIAWYRNEADSCHSGAGCIKDASSNLFHMTPTGLADGDENFADVP